MSRRTPAVMMRRWPVGKTLAAGDGASRSTSRCCARSVSTSGGPGQRERARFCVTGEERAHRPDAARARRARRSRRRPFVKQTISPPSPSVSPIAAPPRLMVSAPVRFRIGAPLRRRIEVRLVCSTARRAVHRFDPPIGYSPGRILPTACGSAPYEDRNRDVRHIGAGRPGAMIMLSALRRDDDRFSGAERPLRSLLCKPGTDSSGISTQSPSGRP